MSDLAGSLRGLGRKRAVAVVAAVARAMETAHRRGEVRGTFSPADVLLDGGELIGIAPRPDGRDELDLLLHAAPEVVAGGAPTPASDVWGLGILLFTVLVGRTPFESGGAWCLDRSTRAALEPSPPSWFASGVDPRLDALCKGCLSLSPERRPAAVAVAWVLSLVTASTPVALRRYEVLSELGRGGMGRVLRARDHLLGRDVALKEILVECQPSPCSLERFRREVELVSRLDHAHVIRVLDAGEREGRPYMAMDLVDGASLHELSGGGLGSLEAARIMGQVARGLQHAHERGVLHRDLKPANVLVRRRDGHAFLSDFGVARSLLHDYQTMTAPGRGVGTLPFFSPEQVIDSSRIGPPSDVWALGVTTWAALTGQSPFAHASDSRTVREIMHEPIPRLRQVRRDVHPVLEAVVHRCLERDPRRRWASAAEVAEELEAIPGLAPLRGAPAGPQRGAEDVWVFRPAGDGSSSAA